MEKLLEMAQTLACAGEEIQRAVSPADILHTPFAKCSDAEGGPYRAITYLP